jgi:hypothetical protein
MYNRAIQAVFSSGLSEGRRGFMPLAFLLADGNGQSLANWLPGPISEGLSL